MPTYTLAPGRIVERDGIAIACVIGVQPSGQLGSPYVIGHPAALDEFAHAIVRALNASEGA